MKFAWKTEDVAQALRAGCPTATEAMISPFPGGDYDTLNVTLTAGDSLIQRIHVTGWMLDGNGYDGTPPTGEVDAITVGDGSSPGGCNSSDPAVVKMYGEIRVVLATLLEGSETFVCNSRMELF